MRNVIGLNSTVICACASICDFHLSHDINTNQTQNPQWYHVTCVSAKDRGFLSIFRCKVEMKNVIIEVLCVCHAVSESSYLYRSSR